MKKKRYLWAAVLAALILYPAIRGRAAQDSTRAGTGSVRICLQELQAENSSREGVKFGIWNVGSVGEAGEPVFSEQYGIEVCPGTGEEWAAAAQKAAGMAGEKPDGSERTKADGTAVFQGLMPGVYLIQAEKENSYGSIAPFLVLIFGTEERKVFPKASAGLPVRQESTRRERTQERVQPVQTGDMLWADGTEWCLSAVQAGVGLLCLWNRKRRKRNEK